MELPARSPVSISLAKTGRNSAKTKIRPKIHAFVSFAVRGNFYFWPTSLGTHTRSFRLGYFLF